MELVLIRNVWQPERTIGEIFVDEKFECYSLEDPLPKDGTLNLLPVTVWWTRDNLKSNPKSIYHSTKEAGRTCIPFGVYDIVITHSRRFNRPLPLLLDVPLFEGIRIHPGNTEKDTEGCILVGASKDIKNTRLYESRKAFNKLFAKIREAEGCRIKITC